MTIEPLGPRPSIREDMDLAFGAVARMTLAPPSFWSSAAALVAGAVKVDVGAEFFGERRAFFAAADGGDAMPRKRPSLTRSR